MQKKFIIYIQLGSPKSPKVSDVRKYLSDFLGDPRVVDTNPIIFKIILKLFILPFRPAQSAKLYRMIWNGKKFLLIEKSEKFIAKVKEYDLQNISEMVYLLGDNNGFDRAYDKWLQLYKSGDQRQVVIVPLFPQYSEATTASVFDVWSHFLYKKVIIPEFLFISNFHKSKAFIVNSARNIFNTFHKYKSDKNSNCKQNHINELVISFHGIPLRRVEGKGDLYLQHCVETFLLLKIELLKLSKDSEQIFLSDKNIHMSFQSRFGNETWLNPYTDKLCLELIKNGSKSILLYCPSFTTDCLETVNEIGCELKTEVETKYPLSQIILTPCLNDDSLWVKDFTSYINNYSLSKHKLNLDIPLNVVNIQMEKSMAKMEKVETLSDSSKSTLKIVFLTLFLDLVSFSIIFPLFPALAKHYIKVNPNNYFLNVIFDSIKWLTSASNDKMAAIVLFGGALGGLYSFLQFFASPLWGGLSDRIGRKKVLEISIFGLFISYVLWFFSGNFTLLILARFIGGIMGGNISTATAVVADITSEKTRSKGMAVIGIAFAMGFIIGPALGGMLSLIDLSQMYPSLIKMGVNPFSMPALFASALCLLNLFLVIFKFKETLKQESSKDNKDNKDNKRNKAKRVLNPFALFKPLPIFDVNLINMAYFFFLSAFSGMEFTLTFLAVERLNFKPLDNGFMFIFIGVILTLVQGGYVRRKANQIGELKMSIHGMISIIPGLLIIAFCKNSSMLYLGLFFLAIGSGQIIPCLTSLVSIKSPTHLQGQSIGIFRSLGAFARVVGPILASIIYWKYGSSIPYLLGSISMLIPLSLLFILKNKSSLA